MFEVLSHRVYRHLLGAQVVALVGTGLLTVALGLLAYELAGADAGEVLGTALAIKMVAYVGVAPVVGAFVGRFPAERSWFPWTSYGPRSRSFCHSLIRSGRSMSLIFLLQSASAAFTPTFQATHPGRAAG